MKIPSGKHKGKLLSELASVVITAMHGAWLDSDKLSKHEFFPILDVEYKLRIAEKKAKRPRVQPKPDPNSIVAAKCCECERECSIRADSWAGKGLSCKPRCQACGGMMYAADQAACVTHFGQTLFGVLQSEPR